MGTSVLYRQSARTVGGKRLARTSEPGCNHKHRTEESTHITESLICYVKGERCAVPVAENENHGDHTLFFPGKGVWVTPKIERRKRRKNRIETNQIHQSMLPFYSCYSFRYFIVGGFSKPSFPFSFSTCAVETFLLLFCGAPQNLRLLN